MIQRLDPGFYDVFLRLILFLLIDHKKKQPGIGAALMIKMIVGDHVVDRLAHAQALGVVNKAGGGAGLAHLLELVAVLPGVGPGAVGKRIANGVVGNRRAVVGGELVFPVVIAVVLLWYLP